MESPVLETCCFFHFLLKGVVSRRVKSLNPKTPSDPSAVQCTMIMETSVCYTNLTYSVIVQCVVCLLRGTTGQRKDSVVVVDPSVHNALFTACVPIVLPSLIFALICLGFHVCRAYRLACSVVQRRSPSVDRVACDGDVSPRVGTIRRLIDDRTWRSFLP